MPESFAGHFAAWDQLPRESLEEFEAFTKYLHGTKNVRALERDLGRPLAPWAARNDWRARKAAWLQALAREAEDGARSAARDLGREHAETLHMLRSEGVRVLQTAFLRGEVDAKTALRAVLAAIEGERLAQGEATARVDHTYDLSGKTDEELAELDRLLNGDGAGAGEGAGGDGVVH